MLTGASDAGVSFDIEYDPATMFDATTGVGSFDMSLTIPTTDADVTLNGYDIVFSFSNLTSLPTGTQLTGVRDTILDWNESVGTSFPMTVTATPATIFSNIVSIAAPVGTDTTLLAGTTTPLGTFDFNFGSGFTPASSFDVNWVLNPTVTALSTKFLPELPSMGNLPMNDPMSSLTTISGSGEVVVPEVSSFIGVGFVFFALFGYAQLRQKFGFQD